MQRPYLEHREIDCVFPLQPETEVRDSEDHLNAKLHCSLEDREPDVSPYPVANHYTLLARSLIP